MRYLGTRVSGLLPIVMSLAALVVVAVGLWTGATRQPDEGTLARIWQILVAGQLPIITWFALRWLPRAPRSGRAVLAAQVLAIIAAVSPVFLLRL